MADPVPEERRVAIGRVIHGVEPVGREVRPDRRAVDGKEGTDDPPSAHRDACEATGSRPLQDPHEDRLGLVVGGVAERDATGPGQTRDTRQRGVTGDPGGLFG